MRIETPDWDRAPARGTRGGEAPPSQKIHKCFNFIKKKDLLINSGHAWMTLTSCFHFLDLELIG